MDYGKSKSTHLYGALAGEQRVQLRRRRFLVGRVRQARAGHERRVLDELVLEAHILVMEHYDAGPLSEQLLEHHAERERDRHILTWTRRVTSRRVLTHYFDFRMSAYFNLKETKSTVLVFLDPPDDQLRSFARDRVAA